MLLLFLKNLNCFTNVQDNVFVQMHCSIQYRVIKENADDAFYELQNPREQITAYVFDGNFSSFFGSSLILCWISWLFGFLYPVYIMLITVVRAHVPKMNLDELFEQKDEVAKAVLEELEKVNWWYQFHLNLLNNHKCTNCILICEGKIVSMPYCTTVVIIIKYF